MIGVVRGVDIKIRFVFMIELILLASAIITLRWWLIRRVSLVVISIIILMYNPKMIFREFISNSGIIIYFPMIS